ncbi:MAG: hypothetical protein OXD43_15250 [Bacteroidetes bacterium]|nr:hypothetical protein [Bacteroidota bacterium]
MMQTYKIVYEDNGELIGDAGSRSSGRAVLENLLAEDGANMKDGNYYVHLSPGNIAIGRTSLHLSDGKQFVVSDGNIVDEMI